MGVVFLEHMGGDVLYSCASCKANLSNKSQIISAHFTGATGPAYLFNKVVNVTFGKMEARQMISGRHWVRDIACKRCAARLGWFYEFVRNEEQRYKEGKYVMERALIAESLGIKGGG